MPPQIALLLVLGFVAWLLRDEARRAPMSLANWIPLAWLAIIASRPVSSWFGSGVTVESATDLLDGSPVDRAMYFGLMSAGIVVLARREKRVEDLLRCNRWLLVFYAYLACSALWSDYPFVALKRWIKELGNLVMILIVLSDKEPVIAVKGVFVRCCYILVPLSLLFIKYYPELGRTYSGYRLDDLMYVGVTLHKNSLGALVLVSGLMTFASWLVSAERDFGPRGWTRGLVLAVALWLLIISKSATSLVCAVGALATLGITRMNIPRQYFSVLGSVIICGALAFSAVNWLFGLTELIIVRALGRDMTFTTRTDIWDIVLSQNINPLLGSGFSSFWLGARVETVWESQRIIQSHNGYLETYLNSGWIGVLLLCVLLVAAFKRIKSDLIAAVPFAGVRLMFLLVVAVYNCMEATFASLSITWFVLLSIIVQLPRPGTLGSIHSRSRGEAALPPGSLAMTLPSAGVAS